MEALLLYRAGTFFMPLKQGLNLEGIRMRDIMWSPSVNVEDKVWGLKLICIYLDKDTTLLSLALQIKEYFPNSRVFIFDDNRNHHARDFCKKNNIPYYIGPWNFPQIGQDMKRVLMNEEFVPEGDSQLSLFSLDSQRRCLVAHEEAIKLRNKEYELLEFLVLNRGRLVSRHTLIEHVWDRNAKISSNTLDVHIGRLRKKIEFPFKTKLIHTVHSIGYRFDFAS